MLEKVLPKKRMQPIAFNVRCRVETLSAKLMPLAGGQLVQNVPSRLICPVGWDILLTDPSDARLLCLAVRNDVNRALKLKAEVKPIGRVRVMCFVNYAVDVKQQLAADEGGVEIWYDSHDLRNMKRVLESVPMQIVMRVKPDEQENIDLLMAKSLMEVAPSTDARKVLSHAKTLVGVANLSESDLIRFAGNTELSRFFAQTL